ncbi:MAG: hypothetical protein IJS15_00880 [Victivallales bacterium]|nr:hypothetical protein [Victivallales bacterium]
MNERIARLVKAARSGEIFPPVVKVEYDDFDLNLADPLRIAKRLSEYMEAQPCYFTEDNELLGMLHFDGSVESVLFPRTGHRFFGELSNKYYLKPQDNLCTFEWQHSNADFGSVIRLGLEGFRKEIIESRKQYLTDLHRLNFLAGLEAMIRGIVRRAQKYALECRKQAFACANPVRKATLLRMAANCMQVPEHPARTFEEAVQCLYFCFMFQSDSIGRPDQYLYPLYQKGMADGTLTKEHAKALLQELYVMIHGWTRFGTSNGDKGAESHFVIGGYTIDHKCAWNELSELILDSLMETDLIRPQVSLRWNRLTPRSVLYKVMDCERKDKNKRIALVNDEPRIKSLMEINKVPWEIAYDYIMVGCNEPAFQGGISLGGNTTNIVRSLVNTLNDRREEVLACPDFDSFYAIYEQELHRDLETILDYSNRFNMLRSRDCNVLSSLFMTGSIARAASVTQGGAERALWSAHFMGSTNLIDSLSIIRQFVFEEKRCTMEELLAALDADWKGHEALRDEILRDGRFYGNDDDFADSAAHRFYRSVAAFAEGRTDFFGHPLAFGNLTGYNPHFEWFGAQTKATPDGRVAGSAFLFGGGQSGGKDRAGATALLMSVAHMDPTGVMTGDSILNLSVDERIVTDDESFEKLVALVETYFKEGGLHIQLNHVSAEELRAAKANPDAYKSLRVRVSGFSAYFVGLKESIQDDVIARTEHTA